MSSGWVFKRRRLVCLAGLSGTSRNRRANRVPNQTSVAAAAHCLLAAQWLVHRCGERLSTTTTRDEVFGQSRNSYRSAHLDEVRRQ